MKQYLTFLVCMTTLFSYAQNVGIGTKNPQNKLHVAGGLRIDKLAAKKDSGIILHNKTGDVYSISLTGKKSDVLRGDGTFSATSSGITDAWLTHGNAGLDTSAFLGTTDSQALRFRVNNIRAGLLHPANGNIALGTYSLQNTTTGYNNVAIGNHAMHFNTEGFNNVAIGDSTLANQGTDTELGFGNSHNTAIGSKALSANELGWANSAVGAISLQHNTSGSANSALGYQALNLNTSGSNNVGVGNAALAVNTYGSGNTSLGDYTMV